MSACHFGRRFFGWASAVATSLMIGCALSTGVDAAEKEGNATAERAGIASQIRDVFDLAGNPVNPFEGKSKVKVLVFLNPECPIPNRYAPEIQSLASAFEPHDATVWLV